MKTFESKINAAFRNQVERVISEKEWTRETAAGKMKIKRPNLSRFLNGEDCRLNTIEKWAKRLRIKLSEIIPD